MKIKRTLVLFLMFITLSVSSAFADEFETGVQIAFQNLTTAYAGQYPSAAMKKGLAVLEFNETLSPDKKGLGAVVREVVAQKITTSQIFFLIDRDSLEASMEEIKLSLTGLVDEGKAPEAGNFAGVEVFITGSIAEKGSDFFVTLNIIDVETGIIASKESFQFPQKLLYDKKREFAFEYIAQYGLGINLQESMAFISSPAENYNMNILDVFVNYRPLLWLNFKLGISQFDYQPQSISGIPLAAIYPGTEVLIIDPELSDSVNYNTAYFKTTGLFGGIDLNWTPVEFFTLGIGAGINMLTPTMIQNYTPLVISDNINASSPGSSGSLANLIIEQDFWPLTIYRFELKPQFFISPRMTVGLYFAMMFSNDVRVYKTTINGDIYYPEDFETDEGIDEYAGLNTRLLADGRNIEDLNLNLGVILGLSVNFYF